MSPAPRILLTNDDGWDSPGLAALVAALVAAPRGTAELLVVAPREERSAIGHAITLAGTLEAEPVRFDGAAAAFVVDGTPADCSKLAIRALFADAPPALCVSGLNRGPNVGVNVFYSGTVGAALEAVVNGVPGIAVSKDHGDVLSPREAARLVAPLILETLRRGMPAWHALNVNVPDLPTADIRGVRITRQGVSGFDERYRELPVPEGSSRRRFRLEGEMRLREPDGMTDAEALAGGWISVTPVALDLTALDLTARGSCDAPPAWEWLEKVPLEK